MRHGGPIPETLITEAQITEAPRPATPRGARWLPALIGLLLSIPLLASVSGRAGVVFDNCQPAGDGGITCDTRPTGDTLMDDEDARYGLLQQASPGWSEFMPDEGYDDMFGGNET